MFSSRSSFDLSPNRLSVALARAHAGKRPILDLTTSNPTRAGIPYDDAAIVRAIGSHQSLVYEPLPFGLPSAREAVALDLSSDGPAVDPSRLVLTASTSEAYAFVFKLLADPDGEILIPHPSYPLFEHLARLESIRAVPYRLAYDGVWHIDIESIRAALSPRTRAIVIVAPNNPTGSYLKQDELEILASFGIPIISDEVFARFPLRDDPQRVRSALEAKDAPLVFSLGGLSKTAALPQMKLAWIAVTGQSAHVQAALARLEVIADAFLSVGAPVQHAAKALLASRHKAHKAIQERTQANLAYAMASAKGTALSLLDVEAGWYLTLRVPQTQSEEEWTLSLLEKDGVYVHPGHFFDFEKEAYLVISLLTPTTPFQQALTKIIAQVSKA